MHPPPPPNARRRSETVCPFFFGGFSWLYSQGTRRMGGWTLLFSFLGWFGCGKIPPSSLGWNGLACMAATDRARLGLGSFFGFLFLSHGCMVTALMTDTSPPSRPSNHQPRPPHLLDTLLFTSLMPKITGLANATPT